METPSNTSGRIRGTTITKPIIYGNIAQYCPNKNDNESHTHSWTIFLLSLQEEVMSYIKKVEFRLHESFVNPIRVVTQAPYVIEESGWGEFEVNIKVTFIDLNERTVQFYHFLKLFSTQPEIVSGDKPLIIQTYDEFVFIDPTRLMHQTLMLNTKSIILNPLLKTIIKQFDVKKTEKEDLKRILEANDKVTSEIQMLSDKIKYLTKAISQVQDGNEKYFTTDSEIRM